MSSVNNFGKKNSKPGYFFQICDVAQVVTICKMI